MAQVNNNPQQPVNNLSAGSAAKGCFGLGAVGGGLVAFLIIVVIWAISSYNGFVKQDEAVKTKWSQVENQYQRRIDLIKNIVATANQYAKHEKGTLESVTNARAHVGNAQTDPNEQLQALAGSADSLANVKMNPEDAKSLQNYAAAQDKMLEQARLAINVVHEAYPDLKADKHFENIQVELEGTENRVAVARKDYNEEAQSFNTGVRRFPANILANIFGFKAYEYFKAQEGADKAPDVANMFDN